MVNLFCARYARRKRQREKEATAAFNDAADNFAAVIESAAERLDRATAKLVSECAPATPEPSSSRLRRSPRGSRGGPDDAHTTSTAKARGLQRSLRATCTATRCRSRLAARTRRRAAVGFAAALLTLIDTRQDAQVPDATDIDVRIFGAR